MSEERYDLNESAKGIGQLYPILVDKKGHIIDGFHRKQADPNWRVQPLDHIDTEEKLLLARCVANWHRREIGDTEKSEWINGLANIYQKQGLKVNGKRYVFEDGHTTTNEIIVQLTKIAGLSPQCVGVYLSQEYKQITKIRTADEVPSRVPASQVIKKIGESRREGYGEQLVERHRAEVREELLEDPEFREEVFKRDIEESVRQRTEERGVPQIWGIERTDEAQDIIDGFTKVYETVHGWGVNHYMILSKAGRLQEAIEIVNRIQLKLQEWRHTEYVKNQ